MKKGLGSTNRLLLFGLFIGVFLALLMVSKPADAATGINETINFQGRLLNSQGATVPDGNYNIQFKIYQDGTGQAVGNPSGTLKWTENHLNNTSQGVQVINGFLSVNLGSITAFGSSIDWNQDTLWLSMNVGNTNASCTPFSNCSPDGEMVPMQRLTAAPYALNSKQLGGLTSSQFVQLAQGVQTDASTNSSIFINKTNTGNLIQLQASGTDIFSASTSSNTVNIGITGSTNANSTIHIADSSAGAQTITIGSTNSTSTTNIKAGSGGINLTGATNINTSGTANTNIGNTSGGTITIGATSGSNLILQDAEWDITGAGAATFASVTSGGDVAFSSSTASAGSITKRFTVGASGVNQNDVVIMTTTPNVQQTTTDRDPKVFGVSKTTTSSGGTATVATSGNYTVNVETGAVAIGDQLVTSSVAGRATVDNNATTGIIGIALSAKSAGANGTVSIFIRPVNGQYTPIIRAGSASATAFQVQSSGGTNYIAVDTSASAVNIGITGSTNANSTIHIADSSAGIQTVTIGSTNSSSTTTIQGGSGGIHLNGPTTIDSNNPFTTGTGTVSLNGDTTIASGKNFTQNGSGTFATGSGTNTLSGNTTVASGKSFTVTDGDTSLGGKVDVTKSEAIKRGSDFTTIGTSNNVNFGDVSLVRLAGGSAQTITGIANGRDGYRLTLLNTGSTAATLTNDDLASSNGNRISTGTGNSVSIQPGAGIILLYDAGASPGYWRVSGYSSDLQSAYYNSSSPQITVNTTKGGVVIQDAASAIGAALFTVQSNGGGTKYLNVDASAVAIQNNVTVTGTYNTNTFSSTALQFGGASGTISTSSGNLTIQAAGTNSLLLDTVGAGTVSVGNSNATTINIANNNVAHTISIGGGGTSQTQAITIGSSGSNGSSVTLVAGSSSAVNLNSASVSTNQTSIGLFNATATTVTAFQAATSLSMGATSGTITIRNANQTLGNAAGSGVLTNNGSTLNSTLALSNFSSGGSIGSAASTVDIYTSISVNQTSSGQTLTIPTPTASSSYGRLLYLSNIGTASFVLGGATINTGTTATMVWSNTNGGASWQFAGADAASILNQNSADQTANFRISGSGRANTSFVSPTYTSTGTIAIKPGSDSANAVQVQNASGAAILSVDSTSRRLRIYEDNGSTNYALIYYDTATSTANFTTNSGTVAVGTGAGAITITSGSGAAVNITGNAASTWKTNTGTLTLQSGSSADLILNAGSNIVSVNGAGVIKLGSSAGDPGTCTLGAIVYNSTTNLFRGCQGSSPAWATLSSTTQTMQQAYTASTGGSTPEVKLDSTRTSFDVQDADSTLSGVLFAVRGSNAGGLGTSILNVNSSNSTVNIGTSANTTSLLVLGVDTNSTFNAGTITSAATEIDGAMFYSSTDHNFLCGTAGQWVTCNGLLYSNTAASSAVNTCTTACAAFSTNNSTTVPANYCQAGRVIRIQARGHYSVAAATTPTLQMGVYYGTDSSTRSNDTQIGASTPAPASASGASNQFWSLDYNITCFSTTSMMGEGIYTFQNNTTSTTSMLVLNVLSTASTSVTTTSAKALYIFPTWSASSASNTVTLDQLVITGN